MIWLCGVLYALRSGVSKFIVKIILRRVLSRSAIRGASTLVSVPVVAFWNGVLARTVMTSVRTVALARSNLTSTVDCILALHVELQRQIAAGVELQQAVDLARTRSHALASPHVAFHPLDVSLQLKEMIVRATALAVVINREFHPNLEQIIKHLKTRMRIEIEGIPDLDDFEVRRVHALDRPPWPLGFASSSVHAQTVAVWRTFPCLPARLTCGDSDRMSEATSTLRSQVFLRQVGLLNRLDTYTVLAFLMLALITDGNLLTSQKACQTPAPGLPRRIPWCRRARCMWCRAPVALTHRAYLRSAGDVQASDDGGGLRCRRARAQVDRAQVPEARLATGGRRLCDVRPQGAAGGDGDDRH